MKLIQYHLPKLGKRVGIVTREHQVIDVTSPESPSVLEVLELAYKERVTLGVLLADIQEKFPRLHQCVSLHFKVLKPFKMKMD